MTDQETEILTLQAALGEAHGKLFEAGKLAGKQAAAITAALQHLEQAHQAVHKGERIATLQHIVDAMAALANIP